MLPYLVLLKAVGSEEGIVVLSFSAVYATVAMVTRFRVLEALFFFLEIVKEIEGKIVRI